MGRSVITRIALALLAVASFASCGTRSTEPRHLVLVVFDTLRADRMSLYGHERPTTPFLESIADELVVFERFKAVAPWTLPTHATLFTGSRPARHRAQWGSMKLNAEAVTLAEALSASGFCTTGFSANPLVKPGNGLAQGFQNWEHVGGPWSQRTSDILDRAAGAIATANADGCRLFLFLNLMDTHIPYNAETFGTEFGASGPGPIKNAAVKWAVSAGARTLSESEWEEHRNAYDASVRAADAAAEALTGLLGRAGVLDQTLLVLTSDHGEGLGSHLEVGHSISVWEEQLAVPLAIRFPKGEGAGRIGSLRSQTGVAPSLIAWLGVDHAGLPSGPSLLDDDQPAPVADYRSYFSEGNRKTNVRVASNYPELARRILHRHVTYCDELKMVAGPDGSRHAYDLATDPGEQHDLFLDGSDPRLRSCVASYNDSLRSGQLTAFDAIDPEDDSEPDLDALRSLGYVQ